MSLPCDKPCVECAPSIGGGRGPVDPANPFVNLSSEAPDIDVFIGRRYTPPGDQPPLGDVFYAVGCLGWCVSTISQQDANICALNQEVLCLTHNWPPQPPNWPPVLPPGVNPPVLPPVVPRPIYWNNQQSCSFPCPDGSDFTFVVPAHTFSSLFNQATVDALAYSYACNQAVIQRMCFGSLSPAITCSESPYAGDVVVSTVNTPVTFTILNELPAGLVDTQNPSTLFISGTPTVPGDYVIAVMATDVNGNSIQKNFPLTVFGFTTASTLPTATPSNPYAVALEVSGTVDGNVVYSLAPGSVLPAGLTLGAFTGVISGTTTETESGNFFITVRATSDSISCQKEFLLPVNAGCGDPDSVEFFGNSGLIATGLDVTLPEAEFNTNGYLINIETDGTPKIAVIQATWGVSEIANWLINWTSETAPTDFTAFGSGSTIFNTVSSKTIRVPVYPYETVTGAFFSDGTAADMGDCHVVTTLDCVGISDILSIVWGAPSTVQSGSGVASISGTGATFTTSISNDATGGDASAQISGTFTVAGNGLAGRLTLDVSNLVSRGSGGTFFPRFVISASSDLDGAGIWFCDSTNNDWLETGGAGTYVVPFVVGCTPGAVITITVQVTNLNTTDAQSITIDGSFSAW